MIVYYSWGQISEIKQWRHAGTLEDSENWVLVSKREKGIAKRSSFLNLSVKFLEIWNPTLDLRQTWHNSAWP